LIYIKNKKNQGKFLQLKQAIDKINTIEFLNYYAQNGNKDFKLVHFLSATGVDFRDNDLIKIIKLCTMHKIKIINVNKYTKERENSNIDDDDDGDANDSNCQQMVVFKRNETRIAPSYFNTRKISTNLNNNGACSLNNNNNLHDIKSNINHIV